jgi:hypothetical protein
MTKLCARGKSAAKRKFKVYPSAYANAYASKICAGKAKDPSGLKRKDWGPKKMLLGGLLTKGIKYGYKQYRKAGGRNIIEIMKSGVRGAGKRSDAKTDVKYGIKMHGSSNLTKRDKSLLGK